MHNIGDKGGRNDLSDLRQQERAKASTGTTSERVGDLKAL